MGDPETVVYEKHKKLANTDTSVWYYFWKATNNLTAKCISCNKILKTLGGSTSGLHTHLKSAHSITLKDVTAASSQASTSASVITSQSSTATEDEIPRKKSKLTDYFSSSNSLPETLSRLTAVDGVPFSFFITSNDQRRIMKQSGYKLPTSSNSIKNIVLKQSETVKESFINKLRKLKEDGVKLSVSLDEWTSLGNRRFMNVNIHSPMLSNNFVNIGLVRVIGSMPARRCLQLLEKRLSDFGLSLKDDIICSTTDGASVMLAFGRDAALYHQQCLARGIQLAILDILYKKKNSQQNKATIEDSDEPYHGDNSSDYEDDDDSGFRVATEVLCGNEFIFKDLIDKVRKTAKLFRKSPTKNDEILQMYVKEEIGHELNLILDCKTRWNSLADMLQRIVRLKKPVQKAVIDLKMDLAISEEEFERLSWLSNIFEILKATVEQLCRRDANLMTSDAALTFMLKKLDSIHNEPVAHDLSTSLKRRIMERRLLIAATLNYLHNPKMYFDSSNDYPDVFLRPDCDEMRKHIIDNQHVSQITDFALEDSMDDEHPSDEFDTLPIKKQLEMTIRKKLLDERSRTKSEAPADIDTLIKIEMALFENGGSRGKYLEIAYKNLLSIPPTSVESERAFSSASYFCNRLRSRLGDITLDKLSFLRSYYLNQIQK